MTLLRFLLAASLTLPSAFALAQDTPSGNAQRGEKIFASYGCYQCHGYQGQGSNAGPRLAPNPHPYAVISVMVKNPRARMPAYSEAILSEQDIADIHAYLQSIPEAKTVDEIPLLSGAR